ncbi:hypothetical protein GCM10010306_073620 [Streptomyces umbrinus]|nr:hypothetical protein GCM10010306_073620 [Streptomyces umbrinus]
MAGAVLAVMWPGSAVVRPVRRVPMMGTGGERVRRVGCVVSALPHNGMRKAPVRRKGGIP